PVTTTDGAPATDCAGCDPGTNIYRPSGWQDILALVYTGQTHAPASTHGARDCAGDVRRSLVSNWAQLFESACGGTTCAGLNRAFRRADLSDVNEAFLSLAGLPPIPKAKGTPGATPGPNPFCNSNGASG